MLWNENEDALLRGETHSQLKWVMIEGELHDVSDFAHLPPAKRPHALCPVCMRPVTMKLGTQRVHHCAHQSGDECVANNPETALHLNMKFHLYRQLQQVAQLLIEQRCTHCQKTRNYIWVEGWYSVEVEYRLDTIRPDVALLSSNQVIAAIEVLVSHAVDDEKAQHLHTMEIPWIEVVGSETFYSGETTWRGGQPLTFYRQQPEPQRWTCESCRERLQAQEADAEYKRNNYTGIYCSKIVDFYFPSGKKFRDLYQIVEEVQAGLHAAIWLTRSDRRILAKVVAGKTSPITKESFDKLNIAFQKELEKRCMNGAIWDSPMNWLRGDLGDEHEMWGTFDLPRRYAWWQKESKWFMPKDNRKINWDRIIKRGMSI